MKWWLYNRFRYLDSKYVTGSSMENRITIRAHQKANVFLKSYANIVGHVYFNAAVVEHRMERGVEYEFEWPASGAEDPVIGINDADLMTSLGDLSPLMVELIDVSGAPHITELKIGDASEGYVNYNMKSITLGNNVLLRTLDLRNCVNLTQSVDASGCANIEEAYFDGTAVTGVSLPNGGILKTLHLPGTITNLTLRNQKALTEFVIPSYANVETLVLENNSDVIDPLAILAGMPANSLVRIIGFSIANTTAAEVISLCNRLDTMRGRDENGNNVAKAQVSGTVYVDSLTIAELHSIQDRYPDITVVYEELTPLTVRFWNGDTLLQTVTSYTGTAEYTGETPIKPGETDWSRWAFTGWSPDPSTVFADTDCYAQYEFVGSNARELVMRTISGVYENDRVDAIGEYAFCGAKELTSVSFPNAENIGAEAFRECTKITNADFPKVTVTGANSMRGCKALSSVNFPALTDPGQEWISRSYNAELIPYAVFPNVVTAGNGAFMSARIALLDLPVCTSLGWRAVANDVYGLILRADSVCTLHSDTGTIALTNIYVPKALLDSYKAATNWSAHADKFLAIEDYPDICGGE